MQVSSGRPHMLTSNQRGRGNEPVTVLGRIISAVAVNMGPSSGILPPRAVECGSLPALVGPEAWFRAGQLEREEKAGQAAALQGQSRLLPSVACIIIARSTRSTARN